MRVLKIWESAVPPDRVHVLTLPPPDGDPGVLWARFCAVTGIDSATCDVGGIAEEPPMPTIEVEVLRRLNGRLGTALGSDYERVVRDHLVGHGLTVGSEATGRAPMGRLPGTPSGWANVAGSSPPRCAPPGTG